MAEEKEKLTKITIISGTAFDGALVEEGQVCEVTDKNRAQADYLLQINKAVAGELAKPKADSNKAVSSAEMAKK